MNASTAPEKSRNIEYIGFTFVSIVTTSWVRVGAL